MEDCGCDSRAMNSVRKWQMRVLRLWAGIWMVVVLSAVSPAWGLSLVENGKPVSTIVVPEQYDPYTVDVAANYIKGYIKKATGAELKIVPEANAPQGTLISVGHTNLAKKAGINTDDLKLDSCKLIVKDRVLFLIGRDTPGKKPWNRALGTWKAAVTFLEKFMGVKWFIPSPEGEFVPETKNIHVPDDLNETITSDFAYSYCGPYQLGVPLFGYPYVSPAYVAYNSYAKIKLWTTGGHSWGLWVPVEKYFKDHPEYFALIGGKRSNHKLNFLCTSNPEVRNIMLREIHKLFDEGYDWVQLGQSDGMSQLCGMCECPECEKLDTYRGNALDILKKHPCERILLLHKWLADECRKSHPDKTVHLLLYGPTRMPSKLFDKFGDNVVGENAIGSFEGFKKICEAWKGKVRGFTAYLYWESINILPLGILPKLTPSSVTEQLRYFHKNNVIGIYYCGGFFGKNWGLWGPVYYTVSRLIDNPDLNPDALVKEYCVGVYGKAGMIMKLFFDQLYSRMDSIKIEGDLDTKSHFLLYYPPHFVRQLDQMLARAEQTAKTEKSRGWLRLTRDYFDYMKTISNMFVSERAYQANPTRSNLLELKGRVDDFETFRERIISYGNDKDYCQKWFPQYVFFARYLMNKPTYDPYQPATDFRGRPVDYGRISSPLTWNFDKKLREFGKTLEKKILVPRAPAPLRIDGNINIAEWKGTLPQALGEVTGGEAQVSTFVRVMYDDKNLYVSYVCHEPEIEKLKIGKLSRDNRIWDIDCVELMLNPENSFNKYQHFIAAPADGSFYDARTSLTADILDPLFGKQDSRWNPDWRYSFKIDKEKKVWSIEMAIPFKSLEVKTPDPGTTWRVNFGRERHAGDRSNFLWSPSESGSFHELSTYGELNFGK